MDFQKIFIQQVILKPRPSGTLFCFERGAHLGRSPFVQFVQSKINLGYHNYDNLKRNIVDKDQKDKTFSKLIDAALSIYFKSSLPSSTL